jgi:hypothetical protein
MFNLVTYLDSTDIINLSLLQPAKFIPSKSSVIICFKMCAVDVNSTCIVINSLLIVLFLSVCEATVMVEISLFRLKVYGLCEEPYGLIIFTFSVKGDAYIKFKNSCVNNLMVRLGRLTFVIVRECILRVDLDSLGVVLNCLIIITYFVKCKTTVE